MVSHSAIDQKRDIALHSVHPEERSGFEAKRRKPRKLLRVQRGNDNRQMVSDAGQNDRETLLLRSKSRKGAPAGAATAPGRCEQLIRLACLATPKPNARASSNTRPSHSSAWPPVPGCARCHSDSPRLRARRRCRRGNREGGAEARAAA